MHKSTAFHVSGLGLSNSMNKFAKRTNSFTNLASTTSSEVAGVGEEGIPEQLRNHKCLYDMILVERLTVPETTKSGLYVPRAGKTEQRVARVVAMPKGYGVESATGNVVPVEVLAPFKAGDLVFVKVRTLFKIILMLNSKGETLLNVMHYNNRSVGVKGHWILRLRRGCFRL